MSKPRNYDGMIKFKSLIQLTKLSGGFVATREQKRVDLSDLDNNVKEQVLALFRLRIKEQKLDDGDYEGVGCVNPQDYNIIEFSTVTREFRIHTTTKNELHLFTRLWKVAQSVSPPEE